MPIMSPEKVDDHQIIQEQNSVPKAAELNYGDFAAKSNHGQSSRAVLL